MRFGDTQRAQMEKNWTPQNLFCSSLGVVPQRIIQRAYGLQPCTQEERYIAQCALDLATQTFARHLHLQKSNVVQALLTASPESLLRATAKKASWISKSKMLVLWQDSFRDILQHF